MTDNEVLDRTHADEWISITSDRDFGEKDYRDARPHHGVIFLRLQDKRSLSKIDAIQKSLDGYADQLTDSFAVVQESQVRFAQS